MVNHRQWQQAQVYPFQKKDIAVAMSFFFYNHCIASLSVFEFFYLKSLVFACWTTGVSVYSYKSYLLSVVIFCLVCFIVCLLFGDTVGMSEADSESPYSTPSCSSAYESRRESSSFRFTLAEEWVCSVTFQEHLNSTEFWLWSRLNPELFLSGSNR